MTKPSARPSVPREPSNGSDTSKPIAELDTKMEELQSIQELGTMGHSRGLLQQRMGQLTLAMLRLARYKSLPITDLESLALRPLLDDRVAFAHAEGDDPQGAPLGMAIWASVSDAVSAKIAEQVDAGIFPVHLEKDDWISGDHVWLLDVIVPTRRAGTAVFFNFGSLIEGRPFKMHPVVAQSVDRSIVDKIRSLGQDAKTAPATTH